MNEKLSDLLNTVNVKLSIETLDELA
jgi:hypothetical protein